MRSIEFWINFVLVLVTCAGVKVAKASPWIAFGEIRGHLEPCGCDPSTDLGGVARVSKYIELERQRTPGLLVFNLGNSFAENKSKVQILKNEAISSALEEIAPNATLYSRSEIVFGIPDRLGQNFVLSNISNAPKSLTTAVRKSVLAGTFEVFGFVEPFKGSRYLEPFSKILFARMNVKSTPERRALLLYNGGSETLRRIQALKIFDEIISSNSLPLDAEFSDEERKNESSLTNRSEDLNEVLRVPLGAQGVILSKELQFKEIVLPLSKFLEKKDEKTSETSCNSLSGRICAIQEKPLLNLNRHFVAWIGKQYEGDFSDRISKIIETYRNKSAKLANSIAESRIKDLENSNFVGSSQCESCHSQAYQIWKNSKHAMAFKTLKDLNRTLDSECVSCHVLGFYEKGGFVSEDKSRDFVNVQCENCHGPRREHILNPKHKEVSKLKPANICTNCHTPPHSPKFNFNHYWETIRHK